MRAFLKQLWNHALLIDLSGGGLLIFILNILQSFSLKVMMLSLWMIILGLIADQMIQLTSEIENI